MCKAQGVLLLALFVGLAHSWDIVFTAGDRLEFYAIDGEKISTVHLNSRNLTAITYDEVHNMLLYVDKQSDDDAICAYNITSSMEYNCYIERSGRNIQGMAFDPVTEALFFTDTKQRSIIWLSLKPGSKNDVNGNLLIKIDDGIPTEIVVDSCRGYIYWINTNTNRMPPNIERAKLNGLERKVVVEAKSEWSFNSLTIDHQAHKLYLKTYRTTSTTSFVTIYDFDNLNVMKDIIMTHKIAIFYPNSLIVSERFFLSVCTSYTEGKNYRISKPFGTEAITITVDTTSSVGIATNDKIKDKFKGILECNQILHDYETKFCAHGKKWTLNGQSLCKCTPGYTGERCEVSVCESTYCFQGNCSITEEGLPICRCNAGYCGERCEVSLCHEYCSNNGSCSLNEKSEPICQCKGDFVGPRCEVSDCLYYCFQGNCSFSEDGFQECKCNAGYSGERCEMNMCHGYCMQGNCSFNEEGLPECRCVAGYYGERCEVNLCHNYCLNNGICSLTEEDEPGCECVREYEGERCEVPVGLNNGDGQCIGSRKDSRVNLIKKGFLQFLSVLLRMIEQET